MTYVVTFLAGIAVALLTSYLTWAGEIRRKGLDAALDFYAAMISAIEEVSRFIGRWGGFGRIDLGYDPEHPDRAEVRAFWETRGKLLELRVQLDKIAVFLDKGTRDQLDAEWKEIWDGFHASGGDDVKKDFKFHQEMRNSSERVGLIVRKSFMSWRGFIGSVLRN